jgi:NAD(P)-dependent dehydrogenase (short-subunit alcohol dehydrogenase family)
VKTSLVVGGSQGLGRYIAQRFVDRGEAVIVTSRNEDTAASVAAELGARARGIPLDLAEPETIEKALSDVESLDHIIVTAIDQGFNSLQAFNLAHAVRSTTVKLVGYPEVVRVLKPRLRPNGSVVLFGGLAKVRPYPGSTMITAANGGVSALVRTLAVELSPIRVNALHPGVVGDSPQHRDKPEHPLARTPIKRAVAMSDIADATDFLLGNGAVNAIDLYIDGGVRVS